MSETIDENGEYINDAPEELSAVLPWVSGIEAFTRYSMPAKKLRELVKTRRIRSKKINGRELYSVEDLEKHSSAGDEDSPPSPEAMLGDLIRATNGLLNQTQTHHEKMFDKLMNGLGQLLKTSEVQIDKQNEHILALEKQALDMREAAERVFNLEHERKMSELREERTRSMQAKALEMLQKTVAPWVASKLGGAMPGGTAPTGETDSRFAQLGQAVVGMVIQMTDEQFAMLQHVVPATEFEVLTTIRESAKGAA